MITYLLKSSLCLALLLTFYHLVLEREKMHRFNRFYLLGSVLFSFLAPLYIIYNYIPTTEVFSSFVESEDITVINTPIEKEINYQLYVVGLYFLMSLLLLFRFCKNLFLIFQKVKRNRHVQYKNATIVLVEDIISPHTFWNYIFINKDEYFSEEIEQELFTHELTHVIQKHTLDILLIEFLQILFWINPIFYFLKKAIKLNHEFLADNKVINIYKNTTEYQYLLLNRSTWNNEYYLASNLNYLLTKKRLQMMTKQSSKRILLLKKLAVLPLLIGSLFLFAQRVEAQEKANSKVVAEYNKLAKKYNTMPKNNMVVKRKDVERIEFLYKKLNSDQKKEAQPYPILPPPPPPPAPKVIKGKSSEGKFIPPPPPPPPPAQKNVASKKEVEEYNRLANKLKEENNKNKIYRHKDVKRIRFLYSKLDKEQRFKSEPFPKLHLAPPPPIDRVYTYNRMAHHVKKTARNRKANLAYLKDLYSKMNAKEKAKVVHPSKILDNKTSQIETIYEQTDKNSSINNLKRVTSKASVGKKEEFGGVIFETGYTPKPKTCWTTLNGEKIYYVKYKDRTEYYNRWGQEVNENGEILTPKKTGHINKRSLDSIPTKTGWEQVGRNYYAYEIYNGKKYYFDKDSGKQVKVKHPEPEDYFVTEKLRRNAKKEYYINNKRVSAERFRKTRNAIEKYHYTGYYTKGYKTFKFYASQDKEFIKKVARQNSKVAKNNSSTNNGWKVINGVTYTSVKSIDNKEVQLPKVTSETISKTEKEELMKKAKSEYYIEDKKVSKNAFRKPSEGYHYTAYFTKDYKVLKFHASKNMNYIVDLIKKNQRTIAYN